MSSRYVITPFPPGITNDTFRSSIRTSNTVSNKITVKDTPIDPTDAVNKEYADSIVNGLRWKEPCRLATTGSITLSGLQTIDDVLTLEGDRVLVKDQGSIENGYYLASTGSWTRTIDMPLEATVSAYTCAIQEGTVNADSIYVCTNDPTCDKVGTDTLNFAIVGGGLTSLNTLTQPIQLFATGTSGTNFNISSVGDTHTFNIPDASGSTRGLLTSADWITFNNKGSGDGDVIGPASSTDNALIRFDGTTGKLVQNSTATLSDTGLITANQIRVPSTSSTAFNPSYSFTDAPTAGLWFDSGGTHLINGGGKKIEVYFSSTIFNTAARSIVSGTPGDFTKMAYSFTLDARSGLNLESTGICTLVGQNTAKIITLEAGTFTPKEEIVCDRATSTITIGNSDPTTNISMNSTNLGFYGVTPVARATTGIAEAAFVENAGGTAVNVDSTFGGYTIAQIVQALQNIGALT